MKIRSLFRRPSRKALKARIAELEAWCVGWQDIAAELEEEVEEQKGHLQVACIDLACANSLVERVKAERDQYDTLARDLANKLSAANAQPATVLDEHMHLSVLEEATGKFPVIADDDEFDFTGWYRAIPVPVAADDEQKALPVGSAA